MLKGVVSGLTVALLLVGLVPSLAQETEDLQPGLAISTLSNLPIFAEADRSSVSLATLEIGELVKVLEVDKPWVRVEYNDVVGWIQYRWMGRRFLVNVSGPTPVLRGYHQMTYDVESDRVILFGGYVGETFRLANDTWSYEVATNTWTQMAPAQSPPPGEGSLAYDKQSDRAILFVGTVELPYEGSPSETWAYDFNSDTWTNAKPSTAPPPLIGAQMVYDAESDRMILFGGIDPLVFATQNRFAFHNETWAYDFDTNTWTQMNPEMSPPGANYQAMAYDAKADRVIMMGSVASEITDDTWIYDYNTDTWEVRQTTESPKHRASSAMVYVTGTGQMILFGEGEPTVKNDTWAYDFDTNTWTELTPDMSPSARGWHAMAYSDAAEQVILFGGGTTRQSFTLETWIYDPRANTWTIVGP